MPLLKNSKKSTLKDLELKNQVSLLESENLVPNKHIPVLLETIIEYLPKKEHLKIFDGTFGGGGYTQSFLKSGYQVWACDLDVEAVNQSPKNTNLVISHSSFNNFIDEFENNFFDVIVLDLGFSSNQLEYSNRGFSYQKTDEILDLRFNQSRGKPCWKKIQDYPNPTKFYKVLYEYSGEKLSPKIAENILLIIKNKSNHEEVKVGEIVDSIISKIPAKMRRKSNAILSRVWQALRIWTNNEFDEIKSFLPKSLDRLKAGGRLMVVTFHSLEDKIVTHFMRQKAIPFEKDEFGNKSQNFKLVEKKGLTPSEAEISKNIRSRSATLRILEKVD